VTASNPALVLIGSATRSGRREGFCAVASLLAALTGNSDAPATPVALITARRDVRHGVLTNENWCRVTPASSRTKDAVKVRSVAWTFLPFIERKCHKARFDQILCRTQAGGLH
jgi:hypothetical protein